MQACPWQGLIEVAQCTQSETKASAQMTRAASSELNLNACSMLLLLSELFSARLGMIRSDGPHSLLLCHPTDCDSGASVVKALGLFRPSAPPPGSKRHSQAQLRIMQAAAPTLTKEPNLIGEGRAGRLEHVEEKLCRNRKQMACRPLPKPMLPAARCHLGRLAEGASHSLIDGVPTSEDLFGHLHKTRMWRLTQRALSHSSQTTSRQSP